MTKAHIKPKSKAAGLSAGSLQRVVKPQTRHCEDCQHRIWSEEYENTPKALQCGKGHTPRFYKPRDMEAVHAGKWGWMKKCHDWELGDHVLKLVAKYSVA